MSALDWNMAESEDSGNFVLLKPGNYPFTVKALERGVYEGGQNIGRCPKAKLTLSVDGCGQGVTDVNTTILLDSKVEWKIGQFFKSLGYGKTEDGKRVVDWAGCIGKSGWCRVENREFLGNDGKMKKSNEVKQFLDPETTINAGPDEQEPTPPLQPQAAPTAPNPYAPRF